MSAALDIDVAILAAGWDGAAPDLARRAAAAAWRVAGGTDKAEVSVALADDARLRELNRHYRDTDAPTNVLAFPLGGAGAAAAMLGDIVVARETAAREAEAQDKPFENHFIHLVVHGMLHLMGYDHVNDADAGTMEAMETEILRGLDIPDPYVARPVAVE